jgi:hypothetical protein
MKHPQSYYLDHMFKKTSHRAAWLPDQNLHLGDVGTIEEGIFTQVTTLSQLNIPFTIREASSNLDLSYSDSGSFNISTTMDTGQGKINGNISIEFNKEDGLVFEVTGSRNKTIENITSVEEKVLELYKNNQWKKNWYVITALIMTDNATIFISSSKGSKLELNCSGDVQLGALKLADPKLNLKLVKEQGSTTKIIGKTNLSPLFKVHGLTKPLFLKPGFNARGGTIKFEEQSLEALEIN